MNLNRTKSLLLLFLVIMLSGCSRSNNSTASSNAVDISDLPAPPKGKFHPDTPEGGAPQESSGRFVIVHSPHTQRDVVLLDTATGKTWYMSEMRDLTDDPVAWVPMYKVDSEFRLLINDHPLKTPPKR